MLRYSLHSAAEVIALDRFMAERLIGKQTPAARVRVLPPWSHDNVAFFDNEGRQRFRATHGLSDKFVVMYSGNHSPCHPLNTLLEAARTLRDETDIHFAFIGGGSEFKTVQRFAAEHQLSNILTLPYQPLDCLSASLSSADLHTVVLGDPYVGIVHPCKIYNILALGTPVLYVGPEASHIGDLIADHGSEGWIHGARNGDVSQIVSNILQARSRPRLCVAEEMAAARRFAHDGLVSMHVEAVERAALPQSLPWPAPLQTEGSTD